MLEVLKKSAASAALFREQVEIKQIRYEAQIRKAIWTKDQSSKALQQANNLLKDGKIVGRQGEDHQNNYLTGLSRTELLQKYKKGKSVLQPLQQFTQFKAESELVVGAQTKVFLDLQRLSRLEEEQA